MQATQTSTTIITPRTHILISIASVTSATNIVPALKIHSVILHWNIKRRKYLYSHGFSFYDLWHKCKDSSDNQSCHTSLNSVNCYLPLVSPNPLFLSRCDNGVFI